MTVLFVKAARQEFLGLGQVSALGLCAGFQEHCGHLPSELGFRVRQRSLNSFKWFHLRSEAASVEGGWDSSQFKNNYFTEMCSGFEAGSHLRLIDFVFHSTIGV